MMMQLRETLGELRNSKKMHCVMKQPNAGSLRDARCAERLVALFETIDVNFPTPETYHVNTLKA
jgi:hypothetical protein